MIAGQALLEGSHSARDVELHAFAAEAHAERLERLEQVVRAVLFAHLSDAHDVQPECAADLDPKRARHVLAQARTVDTGRQVDADHAVAPALLRRIQREAHRLEPSLQRERAYFVAPKAA